MNAEISSTEHASNMTTTQTKEIPVRNFKCLLSQILASVACNLLMLDLNVVLSFSTVLIGQLQNTTGPLALDDTRASWIGSISYICEPIGGVLSGVFSEFLGRRNVMVFLNVPFLLGWVLFSAVESYEVLCLTMGLTGLTVGLVEAPTSTYIGEISQPHNRGSLNTSGGIFFQLGGLLILLLGALYDWRTIATICIAIPIFSAVCVFMVPEAPTWLVSRGRIKDAEKSLCWLRGWADPSVVEDELKELVLYHEISAKKHACAASDGQYGTLRECAFVNKAFEVHHNDRVGVVTIDEDTPHVYTDIETSDGLMEQFKEFLLPSTLRPLLIVIPYMFFVTWSGYVAVKPFMVVVFNKFDTPVTSEWATVIQAVTGVVGAVAVTLGIHRTGKRPVALYGTLLTLLSTLCLGLYAFLEMSDNRTELRASWLPLLLFAVISFLNSFAAGIPWALLCEVFPFRTRSLAAGVSSAAYYLFAFAAAKTFLYIERDLQLHGAFWLYTAINFVAVVFLYFMMPETEGRTLQSIEQQYRQGLSPRSSTEASENKYSQRIAD